MCSHRMHAAIPAVEIADNADPLGIRRPDGKAHARNALLFGQLGAQRLVREFKPTFAKKMQFVCRQRGMKRVRVILLM